MADLVNGFFELLGGSLLWFNCLILLRSKRIEGVSVFTTIFFTLWGCWNLYFYPKQGLWFSFYGGLFLAMANLTWVFLAYRFCWYRRAIQAVNMINGRR